MAFSPSPIKSVKVSIDGVELGDAVHVSGPLYVLKWNPQTYNRGFHKINVTVQVSSLAAYHYIIQCFSSLSLLKRDAAVFKIMLALEGLVLLLACLVKFIIFQTF